MMVKIIEGHLNGSGKKIGIVVSRFNEFITVRLLKGCLQELKKLGVKEGDIHVVWVPGAFEIPLAAKKLSQKKTVDAVICLGAIIRGETLHFDLIAWNTARGIADLTLSSGKPVIFEVLATETVDQANKRSQAKGENKGQDAARAAVEMIDLLKRLK